MISTGKIQARKAHHGWVVKRVGICLVLAVLSALPFPVPLQTAHAQDAAVPTRYTLIVNFDYEQQAADIQQHIRYTNDNETDLSAIVLAVDANRYPRAFSLVSLQVEDGAPVNNYTLEDIRLTIPLSSPLAPGETLNLYLDYDLILPYQLIVVDEDGGWPNPFGYTTGQTNLTDWYPYVPPYDSRTGWTVHPPNEYGEHQVYPMADFDVHLTVTSAPDDVVIAASALPLNDGQPYRYQLESARNFVFSMSDRYRVDQTVVDGTTLAAYHIPSGDNAGEVAFQALVDAFTLYNDLYREYPYDSLSLVQADFSISMEFQGLVFVSEDAYNPYSNAADHPLTRLTAHEVAHQWWYALVGSDQALEPWLDEALATYSERLFYENLRPDALEWWDYRLEFAGPRGTLDNTIYHTRHSTAYFDRTYLAGAKFLAELRQTIGDQAFFDFLREYTRRYSYRIATRADFFDTLEDVTETDFSGLVQRYFGSLEAPPVEPPGAARLKAYPPDVFNYLRIHLSPHVE